VKGPWAYVSGLLDLPTIDDPAERRATWRQAMATLARESAEEGQSTLEGLHPAALAKGVKAAMVAGLVDDLEWLTPPAAGAALYALAAALPPGNEQREIGRRVLSRLKDGNAETFVAMATRMARGAGKGLSTPAVRARVGILTELPIGLGIRDGPLALGLVASRELQREWIVIPSTGSLHGRRMAARLLERAAREAATLALQGDEHPLRIWKSEGLREAWQRLLLDRESLVWRSVAIARGLIAPWVPELKKEIMGALAPELTPTEWRRGATSLAAMVAVNVDGAMRAAAGAIAAGAIERDSGVAQAFVWGIPRAAETEPEAASSLLQQVVTQAGADAAEAVAELHLEFGKAPFIERAAERALSALVHERQERNKDDGAEALAREIARDLKRDKQMDPSLREQLASALELFVTQGARQAYAAAREVIENASGQLDTLDALAQEEDESQGGRGGSTARRTSLAVLRDLDITILERHVLMDLLKLGDKDAKHEEDVDKIRGRISGWVLGREAVARDTADPPHPTLRLRQLRALIHLVDSEVAVGDDARAAQLRQRWCTIAGALLSRFDKAPPPVLFRTLMAALARTLDALVRAGAIDVVDALIICVNTFEEPAHLRTLAEASMDPDFEHMLERYARFSAALGNLSDAKYLSRERDSLFPAAPPAADGTPQKPAASPLAQGLSALSELARELVPHPTMRGEVLRTALVSLQVGLKVAARAESLSALASGGGGEQGALETLEMDLSTLRHLARAARSRLDPTTPAATVSADTTSNIQLARTLELVEDEGLSVQVSRVVSGAEPPLTREFVESCERELLEYVPRAIGRIVSSVLARIHTLPNDRPSLEAQLVRRGGPEPLPAWVPPRRTVGGFYIVKALGAGGAGSVFVVNRVEDRHDPGAEKFALKVPDYSATAARTLSEAEFLQLFRAEASALIALPAHRHLARFVTFDLAARPKPILVMELVEGVTFEQVVEARALDMPRCFALLDGVLQGLEAMHDVGVGHLDIKPSNVVLRENKDAVLVDFGLAGRHIRPGCATGHYGAPEVWGAAPEGTHVTPQAADVYAFGCMAFECLTGVPLFQAMNEMALISAHLAHDGLPPPLRAFASRVGFGPLGELIFWTLRRDPALRWTVGKVREAMRALAPQFTSLKWPLSI
jgi:hypothetical protein